MTTLFIVAALGLMVFLLAMVDRGLYGTWLTPFSVLAFPYAVVVVIAALFASSLELSALTASSVVIWMMGLLLFWASGLLVSWSFMRISTSDPAERSADLSQVERRIRTAVLLLAWATIIAMTIGLFHSLRIAGGWTYIGTEEFKLAYMYGWYAHARVLAVPILVYLLGTVSRNQKTAIVAIVFLVTLFVLAQVKGMLLQPVVAGLVYRVSTGRLKIKFRQVVALSAFGYLGFNIVYLLGMYAAAPEALSDGTPYATLFRHFFFYLTAGVLGFGEAVRSGVSFADSSRVIFAPWLNILSIFFKVGLPIVPGTPKGLGVDVDLANPGPMTASNVFTMFGTIYLYLGPLGAVLYVLVIALTTYFFFSVAQRTRNPWLIALFAFIASQLFFGFFEFYFWHSAVYEVVTYCLVLAFLTHRRYEVAR